MKIFASDYDGTLCLNESVSEENKKAIQMWRSQGNLFGVVSGRSMESMRKEAIRNGLEVDFYIGNNGGAIYDGQFQEIKTYYFPFYKALDILSYIEGEKAISFVINDGYHRAMKVLQPEKEDKKYGKTKTRYEIADLLNRQKIAQIVVSLEQDDDTKRIADRINAMYGDVACAYRNINCVDIAPYGVSKATGLAYMAHHLKLRQQDIYAIGDSFNDIPMISTFYGFAMEQADLQVKQWAKQVQPSVAAAIFRIISKE